MKTLMDAKDRKPMDAASALIGMLLCEKQLPDDDKCLEGLADAESLQLINEKLHGIEKRDKIKVADMRAKIFCASLCGNVAIATLWAYTLYKMYYKCGSKTIDLSELAVEFSGGYPTFDACRIVWEAQKHPDAPMGNMLDDYNNWKSKA